MNSIRYGILPFHPSIIPPPPPGSEYILGDDGVNLEGDDGEELISD